MSNQRSLGEDQCIDYLASVKVPLRTTLRNRSLQSRKEMGHVTFLGSAERTSMSNDAGKY